MAELCTVGGANNSLPGQHQKAAAAAAQREASSYVAATLRLRLSCDGTDSVALLLLLFWLVVVPVVRLLVASRAPK